MKQNTGVALFLSLASFFSAVQELAVAATITFTNNCSHAVWPGILTGNQKTQLSTTGFELAIGASKSVNIPSPWSGRIWARTGCSNDSGIFVCVTGDCGTGQVGCNGAGASLPATFAELLTSADDGGRDLYNVSHVDGFNLPISIAPIDRKNGSCTTSSCSENITSDCPEELQVRWSDGNVVACKSACLAFNESRYCCTGSFDSADKCLPTNYSRFFAQYCPHAYSYAYHDIGINFTCYGRPDYIITFCPSKPIDYPDSQADYLNAHNAARSQVGVPPLTWDNDVAAYTQNYANQRKGDCQLIHSGGRYGENLAWSSADLSGSDAVKMWVDEKAHYDYNSNTCAAGKVCGHYTQVVWRKSLRVGCAKVRCDTGGTFIGCNYDPPGNYVGEKPY